MKQTRETSRRDDITWTNVDSSLVRQAFIWEQFHTATILYIRIIWYKFCLTSATVNK